MTTKVSTLTVSHDGTDATCARINLLAPDTVVLASVQVHLATLKQAVDKIAEGNEEVFRISAVGQCADGV
jgi:hypothetical protein